MSPEMQTDLIRFGTHMLLDSKKTPYINGIGWPYIGPAVKDDEMKVRVLGESIVVGKTLDAYEWVLRSIVKMEPRFSLSYGQCFADYMIQNFHETAQDRPVGRIILSKTFHLSNLLVNADIHFCMRDIFIRSKLRDFVILTNTHIMWHNMCF
jgi:hypothetical protein